MEADSEHNADDSAPTHAPADSPRGRPVVVGLAGGVGAGKSVVARILGESGCLVLDADAEARALLDQAHIAATLKQWWGDDVLDEQGRPRRDVIASIIFSDEAERRRLEDLIHPEVLDAQRQAIAEAAEQGLSCVVIDAPLLYEAGADAMCDAVIFVDAPDEQRLDRVRENRGWDAAELHRREKSQQPVEIKRRKAQYVVQNDAGLDHLDEQTRAVLAAIMSSDARSAGPPGRRAGAG